MINGAIGVVSSIGEEPEQVMSIPADGNGISASYVFRRNWRSARLSL